MGKIEEEPKDVGNEEQVKKAKHDFRTTSQLQQADLRDILENGKVRTFLWRLLEEAKIHDFGYCGDNNYLNHIEGRRELGGWLLKEILTANPKAYTMMQNEAVSRDTKK